MQNWLVGTARSRVNKWQKSLNSAALLGNITAAGFWPMVVQAQISTGATPPQTAQTPALGDGDIVVTANRRSESIQRVGISITAETGEQLKALNILRPEALSKIAPGFTAIPNAGSSVSSFNIRGIGQADFSEHEEQPVAVYQDGVYVSSAGAAGFPIFDVQRVEILRGPQGTLFGRNSTGGLIQFISNQPQEGTSGAVEASYGSYDSYRVQGFVNGGNEKVAARVALYYSNRDGFIKNFLGKNLLAQEDFALRAQLKASFDDSTSLTVRVEGFNQDGTAEGGKATPSYVDANGVAQLVPLNLDVYGTGAGKDFYGYRDPNPDPLVRSVSDPGRLLKRSRTVAATLSRDFGGDIALYAISSYGHVKIRYREDTDGTPVNETAFGTHADSDTYSGEVRIQKTVGKFRWTGGLYFLDINGAYLTFFDLPTLFNLDPTQPNGAKNSVNYSLHTRSFAPFAQVEYDLTDRLTLIAGGRYNWDSQHFDYISRCTETISGACAALFGVGSRPDIVSSLGLLHLSQKTSDWNGKVQLNYRATSNVLAYASVSKGLKGAGYSAASDGLVLPSQLAFKPEKLYAYEIGLKSTLFDR
jgi:iron complex outermembrane receptor protein